MENNESKFFYVDAAVKRKVSWKAVPASAGGVAALLLAGVLFLAGAALICVFGQSWASYLSSTAGGDEELFCTTAVSLGFTMVVFCPVTVACAYRQRNTWCAMRKEERMQVTPGGTLVYEYKEMLGRYNAVTVVRGGGPVVTVKPQRVVFADLPRCRVRSLEKGTKWELQSKDGIRVVLEENPSEEPCREPVYIGSYFGGEFNALLASYEARS